MRSGALEMMLWYVLMAVWIFGTIAAIVHLVVKVHAPTWAVVLIAAAMIVVPVIPVVANWAVVAGRGGCTRGPRRWRHLRPLSSAPTIPDRR